MNEIMTLKIVVGICICGIAACIHSVNRMGENYQQKQRNKQHKNWQYDLKNVWIKTETHIDYDFTNSLRVCKDCGLMQVKVYADLYSWITVDTVEEYKRRIREVEEAILKQNKKFHNGREERRKALEKVVKR